MFDVVKGGGNERLAAGTDMGNPFEVIGCRDLRDCRQVMPRMGIAPEQQ